MEAQASSGQKEPRGKIEVTSVYDIETENWDCPVLCGQYSLADGYFETRDIAELARRLLKPGNHYAHNGGRFDTLAILDQWLHMGLPVTAILAGGRIISARCGKSQLCDSAALWPETLAEITSGQKDAKIKLPLKCICPDDCGGYCAIKRSMSAADYAAVSAYLRLDCISLWDALFNLQNFAEENDLDLGLTIGSAAFRNAKRLLNFENDSHTLDEHAFRRSAYFGGRVQTFRVGSSGHGFGYDVISMYPSLLSALPLPVGQPRGMYGASARRSFLEYKPGIYRVSVTVPEQHIPPLPYRSKKRLHYPYGTFEGTYTGIELHEAVERYGVTINNFRDARVYSKTRQIFGPWVDHLIGLRMKAGKKTPLGLFLKRYMNSVYGKLASKPDKLRLLLNPQSVKEGDEIISDGIVARHSQTMDACMHPVWAAYVTSGSRIKLGRKLHETTPETALYCDTDGILSTDSRPAGLGAALGDWEQEQFSAVKIIAPKVYGINKLDGSLETKAKGIRLKKGEMPIPGKVYKASAGVKGAKSVGSRSKFFERNEMTRQLSARTGDRIELSNGATRAPHIEECGK